jgi:hypothetical protein
LPEYDTVPIIVTAVNDTLVIFAISYRMLSSAMIRSTWRARVKSFFTGDGLMLQGSFTEWTSLLFVSHFCIILVSGRGTNQCISVTNGVAIATTALILSPRFPVGLKPVLCSVYIALSSVMACCVYRIVVTLLTDLDSTENSQLTTNPILSSVVQRTPPTYPRKFIRSFAEISN